MEWRRGTRHFGTEALVMLVLFADCLLLTSTQLTTSSPTSTPESLNPGVILVESITSDTLDLRWGPVDNNPAYIINAEPSAAIQTPGILSDLQTRLNVLRPGAVFNITLYTITNNLIARIQTRSAPASPTSISLEGIDVFTANISWGLPDVPSGEPVSMYHSYEIYTTNADTNERRLHGTVPAGSERRFTVMNLTPGTNFTFEVGTLLNPSGEFPLQRSDLDKNPTVTGMTDGLLLTSTQLTMSSPTPTSTPESLDPGVIIVESVTSDTLDLRWGAVDTPGYLISAEPSNAISTPGFITGLQISITLLRPGAVFNITLSTVTNMLIARIQTRSAPASPTSISLDEIDVFTANISWRLPDLPSGEPVSMYDSYEIYTTNADTNERRLHSTIPAVSERRFTVMNLTPGTNFTFEVGTLLNPSGDFPLQRSDLDKNPIVTGMTGNLDPGVIIVESITSDTLDLRWGAVDTLGYLISAEPINAILTPGFITGLQARINVLRPGAVFNITLNTITNGLIARIQTRSAPASPRNISLDEIDVFTANILWGLPDLPSGEPASMYDSYEIYTTNADTNERRLHGTVPAGSKRRFTVMNLTPGSNFTFEVGTLLNPSGEFSPQRSDLDKNPTVTGMTASAPLTITLQLDMEGNFLRADVPYTATCNATGGMPPHNITWFIGTTQITTGIVTDNTDPNLSRSVLTFSPTTADHRSTLACRTSSGASRDTFLRVLKICPAKNNVPSLNEEL